MRKIYHLDPDFAETSFIFIIKLRSLPFTAMEHHVEFQFLPGGKLIHRYLRYNAVNVSTSCNYSATLFVRYDRKMMFIFIHYLISADANY